MMFLAPAAVTFGALPPAGGVLVADAGSSLLLALVVAIVALACGIGVRLAVDARMPRIEVRPSRVPDLRRVA